ncbi:MAG: large-conductance mechanosensitive channel protein MscL [Bacteroidales bacterium]|jgi:large conductance mechanosensitive channel|nr:large-conductance mechanosensitive channel protein MscL [Bacteroidales bacterium]
MAKKSGFFTEFKNFAMRGNVIDMAVGIIIGGAFGKIVSSIVTDIIMPPLGLLIGNMDFSKMHWIMREAVMDGAVVVKPAVTLNYGEFINMVINFIIIAFSVFLVIRTINKVETKAKELLDKDKSAAVEETAAPAPPSKEETLLTEIRDLLKEKNAIREKE